MKKISYYLLLYTLFSCNTNNYQKEFQPIKGDILFQDLDSSPLCDAIEQVTPGYKNGDFSHIGIVIETGDPYCKNADYDYNKYVRILEAIPEEVKTTRLDSFLNRSYDSENNPKVIVGRLKKEHRHIIDDAVSFLKGKIGEEYDHAFLINNNSYYCSELIYDAFITDSIFQLTDMTFLHPVTNDTLETWKKYYADLDKPIPQNEPGINPGMMSISEKIEIVHIYGNPANMKR